MAGKVVTGYYWCRFCTSIRGTPSNEGPGNATRISRVDGCRGDRSGRVARGGAGKARPRIAERVLRRRADDAGEPQADLLGPPDGPAGQEWRRQRHARTRSQRAEV